MTKVLSAFKALQSLVSVKGLRKHLALSEGSTISSKTMVFCCGWVVLGSQVKTVVFEALT